jgi:hypothetical protein
MGNTGGSGWGNHSSLFGKAQAGFALANALDELNSLAQALEVQKVLRGGGRIASEWQGVICPAHGDRGMATIRQTNNEIRIRSPSYTDHLDLLAAEWVVRMADGDESRRRLGRSGSLL